MWYVRSRIGSWSSNFLGSRQCFVPQSMPLPWVVSRWVASRQGRPRRYCDACEEWWVCHLWGHPPHWPHAWYCGGCWREWAFLMMQCRHCGEMSQYHQFDDLHHWYCDGCWDWWAAFQRMWELYSVLMLRQRSHCDIQQICASPVGLLIGSFIGEYWGDAD